MWKKQSNKDKIVNALVAASKGDLGPVRDLKGTSIRVTIMGDDFTDSKTGKPLKAEPGVQNICVLPDDGSITVTNNTRKPVLLKELVEARLARDDKKLPRG